MNLAWLPSVLTGGIAFLIGYLLGRKTVRLKWLEQEANLEKEFSDKLIKYQEDVSKIREKYDLLINEASTSALDADRLGKLLSNWPPENIAHTGKTKP